MTAKKSAVRTDTDAPFIKVLAELLEHTPSHKAVGIVDAFAVAARREGHRRSAEWLCDVLERAVKALPRTSDKDPLDPATRQLILDEGREQILRVSVFLTVAADKFSAGITEETADALRTVFPTFKVRSDPPAALAPAGPMEELDRSEQVLASIKETLTNADSEALRPLVDQMLGGEEGAAVTLIRMAAKAYADGHGPGGFRTQGTPLSQFEAEIRDRWPSLFAGLTVAWEEGRSIRRPSDVSAADAGVNKRAYYNVEVQSVEFPLALPREARVHCRECSKSAVVLIPVVRALYDIEPKDKRPRRPEDLAKSVAGKALEDAGCECRRSRDTDGEGPVREVVVDDVRAHDYCRLTVGDIPHETSSVEGRDDIELDVHLVGPRAPTSVGRLQLFAEVIEHPRTRRLELIATEFRELEVRPVAEPMTPALRAQFAKIGAMGDMEWHRQVGPRVVGLDDAKEAVLLVLHAVPRVTLPRGHEERGMLNLVLLGDTSTGKSVLASDVVEGLRVGGMVHGETAGRTGLLYSITQSSSGRWSLRWGKIPRFHGQLIVLNEAGKLPREEIAQYRSVRREQRLVVDRVASAGRPVAVREIATLNPDSGAMADFVQPANALAKTVYQDPADIARTDLVVTFADGEPPFASIAEGKGVGRPVDPEVYRRFVYWAWNIRASDIIWADGTSTLLTAEAIRLFRQFHVQRVPLVNNGLMALVARVACSYAARAFSTDTSGNKLIVAETHVRRAVAFLERMWKALGLDVMVAMEVVNEVHPPVAVLLAMDLGRPGLRVLQTLSDGGWLTADSIAERLSGEWRPKSVLYQVEKLRALQLVESRPGLGVHLAPRGAGLLRAIDAVGVLPEALDLQSSPTKSGEELEPRGGVSAKILAPPPKEARDVF